MTLALMDWAAKVAQLKADTQVKREQIMMLLAEEKPTITEEPPIRYDRDDPLWRPVDPQVAKAMVYIRKRMKELARKR
jgi:hypothetical protein